MTDTAQIEDALRDCARAQCPDWPAEAIARIARIAAAGAELAVELAARPVLIPVERRARKPAGRALIDGLGGAAGTSLSVFLTHAMIQLLTRQFERRAVEQDDPRLAVSAGTYATVRAQPLSAAFPLSVVDAARVAQIDHVFAVFDRPADFRSDFPQVVGVPFIPPSLTAAEAHGLEGGDAATRLLTLEDTRWSCGNWYRAAATVHAVQIAMGPAEFAQDMVGRVDFGEKLDAIKARNSLWQDVSRHAADGTRAWLDHLA